MLHPQWQTCRLAGQQHIIREEEHNSFGFAPPLACFNSLLMADLLWPVACTFRRPIRRTPMLKQLAHVNFFSDNAQGLLAFYVDQLGLTVKFTLNHDDGTAFGWYVDCGNSTFIEIFDQKGAVKQWGGQVAELVKGNQYRHLCFEVTNLEEYRKRLIERGLTVTAVTVGMDHSKQAWISDPDGNPIELMEYTSESEQVKA
jgi:lactoylglutathione lyase